MYCITCSLLMWTYNIVLLVTLLLYAYVIGSGEDEEPVLYYYGIEESERSLPLCEGRQACSALFQRYWRAPALVRLCRCARRPRGRQRCDAAPASASDSLIPLNNRAHLLFCQPINTWPVCTIDDNSPLTVETTYERINPDELEMLHHRSVQLVPPKITFQCRCRNPNYWKLHSKMDPNIKIYQCASLPLCRTGEYCGNVNYDLNALYQSCLCPKHHICVHNGGVTHTYISELLYRGRGWKAYCQRAHVDRSYDSYEEY